MTPEDYVSYPLALALKKAGFDWKCRDFYWTSDGVFKHTDALVHKNSEHCTTMVAAPTLAVAQKWLRVKKELCVTVYAQPYNGLPYYTGYILFNGDEKEVLDQDGHWFDDYDQCLSETIATALELIEKKGE